MSQTANVYYSIGVDKKGRLVEVLINGKRVDFHRANDSDSERRLRDEIVFKLRSYERDRGTGQEPPTPPPPPQEPIDACCLVDGDGTLFCWC